MALCAQCSGHARHDDAGDYSTTDTEPDDNEGEPQNASPLLLTPARAATVAFTIPLGRRRRGRLWPHVEPAVAETVLYMPGLSPARPLGIAHVVPFA